MESITPQQLNDAIVVLLAIFAAIITLDKVVDIWKKWKAPTADTVQKLANDKRRLDAHEKSIEELQRSNQVLCSGIMALLDHELHDGNSDQMQEARDNIMKYLQGKLVR
jgi:hypothetical protein